MLYIANFTIRRAQKHTVYVSNYYTSGKEPRRACLDDRYNAK